jgi:hypothetical protein
MGNAESNFEIGTPVDVQCVATSIGGPIDLLEAKRREEKCVMECKVESVE